MEKVKQFNDQRGLALSHHEGVPKPGRRIEMVHYKVNHEKDGHAKSSKVHKPR